MFEKEKKSRLSRSDYSKKGSVDSKIKPLLDSINRKKEYYTTSSCSGRIVILNEGRTKKDAEWLFVSHNAVKLALIGKAMEKAAENTVWLRFEPLILHICCDSMESAENILDLAKKVGFKHSGIISTSKRIIAEIKGTDFISAPLNKNADKSYLELLVKEANKKMNKNDEKIMKLTSSLT